MLRSAKFSLVAALVIDTPQYLIAASRGNEQSQVKSRWRAFRMVDQLRFEGRVAIVTGAGSGLGRAYALALAARGARVLVNDTGVSHRGEGVDTEAADSVVSAIRAAGGAAEANYDSVEFGKEIVRAAINAFGRVDILINNAGIRRNARFGKMTPHDWNLVVKTALLGTFSVTKHAWEYMRVQRYGRIVNMAGWAGLYGDSGQVNYAAASMAILGMSQCLAREGELCGIRVNTLVPLASSRLSQHHFGTSDDLAQFSPERVSPVVLYLCHHSCEATGSIIEAGGGTVDAVRWQRAKGAFFTGEFSPEELVARWSEVEDFAAGEAVSPVETELEKTKRRRSAKL